MPARPALLALLFALLLGCAARAPATSTAASPATARADPLTTLEVKTHQMGNEGFKLRKTLGSTPLSRYIECGTTQIGPNAESYDVVLTLLTQLYPADGGSTSVTHTFEGSAKPVTYSQDYSRCSPCLSR